AAVNLLDDMLDQELEPDLFTYSSVLDALAADARWADAVDVVQDLRIRGKSPNNAVASTLLPIAPWTAALHMWLEAQHGLEPDQVLCGAHLASMEQGYYWQKAVESMRWMQTRKLDLTKVTYASAVLICANARRWPEAADLLGRMEASSMKPAASSYALVLSELEQRAVTGPEQTLMSRLSAAAAKTLSQPAR
ncbi:PPR10, partial [Symbiodinium sp. CCMP2456]